MKAEHLDELLLDRAVGELPPAVAALLDDHLARDPAAASRAASLSGTVQLARTAVRMPAAVSLPPLAVLSSLPHEHTGRGLWASGEWLRLAAAVVIGVLGGTGIGVRLMRQAPVFPAATLVTDFSAEPRQPGAGFWSASRRTAEFLRPAIRPERNLANHALLWKAAPSIIPMEEKP